MRKVVSNTTPLLSLLIVNKLEILRDLYGKVCIPTAVYNEIEAGKDKLYYTDIKQVDWIEILSINDTNSLKYFLDLDRGEAEAIILATELKADLILLDERLGRFHANHAGLKISGSLGVLLKAKKEKIIKEVKPLIDDLKRKGIWIHPELVAEILKLAKEE